MKPQAGGIVVTMILVFACAKPLHVQDSNAHTALRHVFPIQIRAQRGACEAFAEDREGQGTPFARALREDARSRCALYVCDQLEQYFVCVGLSSNGSFGTRVGSQCWVDVNKYRQGKGAGPKGALAKEIEQQFAGRVAELEVCRAGGSKADSR